VKHDGLDEICYDPAVIIARRWGLLAFALTACGPVVDIADGLSYAFQDTPESYGVETTEISIFGMVAGSFVTTDDVDLLHWDNEEPEVSLRPREEDGDWPTVLPVTVVGPWLYAGDFHTLQADGEGSLEILHRSAQGDDSVYDLWSLEPCR
jgi:hypothetical protein